MKKIKQIILSVFILITTVQPVLAQGIGCGGGLGVIGQAFCNLPTGTTGKVKVGNSLNRLVSGIIGFLTMIAALWFLFQFIIAGFNWINAGGDKGAAQAAREKITNAVVGLLVVVSAWVLVALLGSLIGLDILNPGAVLQNLKI
ncbi:hypothetical protein A2W14_05515 [Candidatus Gottesmanbacteria bacterium RBG_16_37_8]|uniref:Uncharacterized protein n=1 Tax=Candidatus Gottesmanbacteria bacterium RBG_16_37_8 TaxID=1798371 RepID=A0A1F5YUL6_9BACT|nr:MAG: hypothetical protein A2W14_05515 [Candidatus Gottesmanbacteria bacterium RBG_16_37_8]